MYALYDTKSDKEWPTFFTDEEELASDIEEVISRSKAMFGSKTLNYLSHISIKQKYIDVIYQLHTIS